MKIPEFIVSGNHLPIERFIEMDRLSVSKFGTPIELLMENAGLQLARLVVIMNPEPCNVLIGVGPGNNGGGGLVAARRLAGWGYHTFLDIPDKNFRDLPALQFKRALAVGTMDNVMKHPDIFVDAYLGFSQRLPLPDSIRHSVMSANKLKCPKISLDLPTGFDKHSGKLDFQPDIILTLAAMKTELIKLMNTTEIYIADLGLPKTVYSDFGIEQGSFNINGLLKAV